MEIICLFPNVKYYIKSKTLVVQFTIFKERLFESMLTTLTVEVVC